MEIRTQIENDSSRMIHLRQAVELAQKKVRRYIPEGTSLVEELFTARKEEAARQKVDRFKNIDFLKIFLCFRKR